MLAAQRLYDTGLSYGSEIARIIIGKFPDGITETISADITGIVKDNLASVIDTLALKGVRKPDQESFSAGYFAALGNSFLNYRNDILSRIGLKQLNGT
jgi:hypothetical protein